MPGHHVDGRTMFYTLRTVTGRRVPHVIMPATMMLPAAWIASAAQRIAPFHIPAEYEGVLITGLDTRCDDSRASQELGIQPRELVDTYRDTLRWLYESGQLTARQVGTLAAIGPPPPSDLG